jgi:hypothetical protein
VKPGAGRAVAGLRRHVGWRISTNGGGRGCEEVVAVAIAGVGTEMVRWQWPS